jgi:hypothetical protein
VSGQPPFTYCIETSHIKSIVVFGPWWGSCCELGTYLALSHTNIEIQMEWSQQTGSGWKEMILSCWCTVLYLYFKANIFFPAGFRSQLSSSSQWEHHSTNWSCRELEIHMNKSHVDLFEVNTICVRWTTFHLLYWNIIYQIHSCVWVLVGKLLWVWYLPSYLPY